MQYGFKLVPVTIREASLHLVASKLGLPICCLLPAMYAISRCDSISSFSHTGTITTFLTLKTNRANSNWQIWSTSVNFFHPLNPIQDGLFRSCSRMGGGAKWPPFPKICHTYPTMMKLGTVISYPKKIQQIYESRDTPLEFCWHQHFFTRNHQILLSRNTDMDCILIHNFYLF